MINLENNSGESMVRYRGVAADPHATAEKFAEIVGQMGYKTKVIRTIASSRVEFKKGLLGRQYYLIFRRIGDDLLVEGPISKDIIQALDDAVLSCSSNPAAFKPFHEAMQEEAAAMVGRLGQIFGRVIPTPTQPTPPSPPPAQPPPRPKLEACPNCGAPLRYDPEEIIVTCSYCGYTINVTGEEIRRHSMLPLLISGAEAIKIAKEYAAKSIFVTKKATEEAEWGDVRLYWVPLWLYTVNVRGYVVGRKALIATRDTKKQVLQEIGTGLIGAALSSAFGGFGRAISKGLQSREERAEVSETLDVPVIARKSAMFQLEAGKWRVPVEKKEPYRKAVQGEVLGAELTEREAREKAVSEALATIRSRYTVLLRFDVDAQVLGEGELIHAPFWFIKYTMKGKEYAVVVDACSGQVVAGKRPWLPPLRKGGKIA